MKFLEDENESFLENRIFPYNRKRKIAFGIMMILGGFLAVSFVLFYMLVLKNSNSGIIEFLNMLTGSITRNILDSTLLGVFYTALIGGLFFIFVPTEVLFARFISSGNPFAIVLFLYLLGILISYTINYFIGMKLSRVSKKIISPKKFYSLKGYINRYGGVAIYGFNALPLPSQLLAAILGVFRYNKTRFYVFLLLGQVTKCAVIALGVYKFL